MSLFTLYLFNFITSMKQIIVLKNWLNQMETVGMKRNVTDVANPFTGAET